jgi:hypothetical protein
MNQNLSEISRRVLDISPLDCARAVRRRLSHSPRKGINASQARDLKLMRNDNEGAGPPFAASLHWQEVNAIFDNIFHREGIRNPEEQRINLRFSGLALGDPRLHRYVCWLYRCILKQRDSFDLLGRLQATCKEERGLGYRFGRELLSLDLLLSIDDFYNLYELNPAIAKEPVVVGEVGAGWGRLGYVLRQVNPQATYIIFDLPEALLISQTYLPCLLGDLTVSPYVESRSVARFSSHLLSQKTLWFCGPQDLTRFDEGTIDYIVNIGSFQEMPEEYVRLYFGLFDNVAGQGYCYLQQLREGRFHNHHLDEIKGLASYPFPKGWDQVYCRPSTLSDEIFEAGFRLSSKYRQAGHDLRLNCASNLGAPA